MPMKYRLEIEWRVREAGRDVRYSDTLRVEAPTSEEAKAKARALHGPSVVVIECIQMPLQEA